MGPPSDAQLEAIGVDSSRLGVPTGRGQPPPFEPHFLKGRDARRAETLVKALLRYDPRARTSAPTALEHEWVLDFRRSEEEPSYPDGPVRLPIDDDVLLSPTDYRDRLTLEIAKKTSSRDPKILSRLSERVNATTPSDPQRQDAPVDPGAPAKSTSQARPATPPTPPPTQPPGRPPSDA